MPYHARLAESDPAARAAGRSLSLAYRHLRAGFEQVAELLLAADQLLGGHDDPWFCDHARAVWHTSADIDHPEDWIPPRVVRFWRQPDAREWSRAIAVQLFLRETDEEPWLGCFALAPLGERPLAVWSPVWCDDAAYEARWLDGLEGSAFGWSEPRPTPGTPVPVRACGYYLRLTDVASTEDLAALVIGPLRALARSPEVEAAALPSPLPRR